MAESFLISYQNVSDSSLGHRGIPEVLPRMCLFGCPQSATYLLERLIVDEACGILGNLELSFLDLLAKLPME